MINWLYIGITSIGLAFVGIVLCWAIDIFFHLSEAEK